MKRLFLSLILIICTFPLFILYIFLRYDRYLTRLYNNMALMLSFHRMTQDMLKEMV